MRRPNLVAAAVMVAGSVAFGAIVGQLIRATPAKASATHTYTLRLGDRVAVPALGQVCSIQKEGGAVELFCAKRRTAHHQVTIFPDRILVWKVGSPDHPVWTGKP